MQHLRVLSHCVTNPLVIENMGVELGKESRDACRVTGCGMPACDRRASANHAPAGNVCNGHSSSVTPVSAEQLSAAREKHVTTMSNA